MRVFPGHTDLRLIAGVVFGALAFFAGAFFVTGLAVNHWIEKDSATHSKLWAETLASHIPDLQQIAEGVPPSTKALDQIEMAKGMGKVFRFKVFDRDGRPRLVSDATGTSVATEQMLATHNPTAAQVVATGQTFTIVRDGTPEGRPATYASTYLPIMRDGQMIAVIETYVDESETAALFRRELTTAGIGISLLLVVLVILPFIALRHFARARALSDARASFLAQHDSVTGLLNRPAFLNKLDKCIGTGTGGANALAIHHIDIDGFKALSEDLGPDLTDALVRMVALRARDMVRTHDFVGRLGTDELLVAQCGIKSRDQAEAMVRRLQARLSEPYALDDRDIRLSFSIGSALAPDDAANGRDLVHKAGLALMFVKNAGGQDSGFFRDTMEDDMQRRRTLERRLRQATREQDFVLYFQPIMGVANARVTGFEALLRLPDGNGGLIMPNEFLPLAEKLGLLPQIGDWVLATSCAAATQWPDGIAIAVNLSPSQFAEGTLPARVAAVLAETGLEPARLELEITENLLLRDDASVMAQLADLKALGVSIVMDDFGSGYSSLSYLWRFPFDKIKIDRSFMAAYTNSAEAIQKILSATVALGHALNMQVTIEGVETVFQARALETVACDRLQGYLFGKPMADIEIPASLLREFLHTINQLAEQAETRTQDPAVAM
ncbi:putative bifunctional diguanylate cyclase/phosphodiesterase [Pannonibacter sp. SL95]|uniref:putative bifunctional diguanylate cyclase/phosphodiesterase n=1 Tax=Pannonibacter sp. SL95 TaxID=2995153 RepID=UPI002275E967|nr:bifunctional diguanylate cyclase/phosphodiesterase [Pannonibacter sp. SL95]MCY1706594.1 bifunctional diguanylate cyclase/phosphodiesterase [Pannonibacter sp. SL95]